jgi:hypothetical protein
VWDECSTPVTAGKITGCYRKRPCLPHHLCTPSHRRQWAAQTVLSIFARNVCYSFRMVMINVCRSPVLKVMIGLLQKRILTRANCSYVDAEMTVNGNRCRLFARNTYTATTVLLNTCSHSIVPEYKCMFAVHIVSAPLSLSTVTKRPSEHTPKCCNVYVVSTGMMCDE